MRLLIRILLELLQGIYQGRLKLPLAKQFTKLILAHFARRLQITEANVAVDEAYGTLFVGDESLFNQQIVDLRKGHLIGKGLHLLAMCGSLSISGHFLRLVRHLRHCLLLQILNIAIDNAPPPLRYDIVLLPERRRLHYLCAPLHQAIRSQLLPLILRKSFVEIGLGVRLVRLLVVAAAGTLLVGRVSGAVGGMRPEIDLARRFWRFHRHRHLLPLLDLDVFLGQAFILFVIAIFFNGLSDLLGKFLVE